MKMIGTSIGASLALIRSRFHFQLFAWGEPVALIERKKKTNLFAVGTRASVHSARALFSPDSAIRLGEFGAG